MGTPRPGLRTTNNHTLDLGTEHGCRIINCYGEHSVKCPPAFELFGFSISTRAGLNRR
jgi:hypothetical protein